MSKFCINFVGDSLTFTSFSHSYQSVNKAAATVYGETSIVRKAMRVFPSADVIAANYALSGNRMADLETQAAELDALINPAYSAVSGRPARYYILVVMIGTNVQSVDPVVSAARVRTYCLARQAAGWLPIICTLPSRTDAGNTTFDVVTLQPQNAIFRTWTQSDGVYGIIDHAADPEVGATGASLVRDPTPGAWFDSFGIHPNATANSTFMGPRTKAALNTLIDSLGGGTPL
jgi:hypothetical protein